ncbi:MAG TPA: DegT/DnrJ/EryC1/StrS family aminotransferase [Xanthobacteraceae bacterium]|nr:DegT/DnrJ/EryC1/StrS family aminotransferase [Xanthobacteraceae bacterium]
MTQRHEGCTLRFDQIRRRPRAEPGRHFARYRAEIEAAIARVFARGRFILGEEVAAFETEFAHYLGVRHVVGVASGTQALFSRALSESIAACR